MSEALKPTLGEQTQEATKPTKWDNLANPNETWQEHLKNANSLIESIKKKIDSSYIQHERLLVNQQKELQKSFGRNPYEDENINPPSTLKKAQRMVLDTIHVSPSSDHHQRVVEASAIAAEEIAQDKIQEVKIEKQKEDERAVTEILSETQNKIANDVTDIINGENEFLSAMDEYREDIVITEREKRAQEMFERGLNDKMNLHVDDIVELSKINGSGVTAGEVLKYGDKTIETYHIKDLPFRFIQHALDFKANEAYTNGPGKGETGTIAALELLDNPILWLRGKDETAKIMAEQRPDNIIDNLRNKPYKIGNTLSTSYINLGDKQSRQARLRSVCAYGWTKIRPDTVLKYGQSDLGLTQEYGDGDPLVAQSNLNKPAKAATKIDDDIDRFDNPSKYYEDKGYTGHNEIGMRRFNEDGEPWRPEFVIYDTKNYMRAGAKSIDTALKHAAFHDVPIFIIDEATLPASPTPPDLPTSGQMSSEVHGA